jgi:CubicO group peptidase (beta-lactamase class C family)
MGHLPCAEIAVKLALLSSVFVFPVLAQEPRDLSAVLEPIRGKYSVPACGVAVVEGGKLIAIGVAGKRRVDRETPVSSRDLWHIGSCTKAMTAALLGMMVDEGRLRWEMPITEALPEIEAHPKWKGVTLEHLVTQRSGIRGMTRAQWRAIETGNGTPREQRARYAKQLLAEAPEKEPGTFAYSNSGYGLLGAAIERAADKSYENLLADRIFKPLEIKSAGIGAPGKAGEWNPSQPWGHYRNGDSLFPATPGPDNQFPPALSPAACVHMSLPDFARFAWWISSNEPALVEPSTFQKLQTPPSGSTYSGGLWKTELPGVGGAAVSHSGHMGGFFGVFHAGKNRACVSVFNTEGGGWEWLGDELASAALKSLK